MPLDISPLACIMLPARADRPKALTTPVGPSIRRTSMTPEAFTELIASISRRIEGKPLDKGLEHQLNAEFPPDGEAFRGVFDACRDAVAAGWMCNREGGGIKYGRVIKPGVATNGFSVDVGPMADVKGSHHRTP